MKSTCFEFIHGMTMKLSVKVSIHWNIAFFGWNCCEWSRNSWKLSVFKRQFWDLQLQWERLEIYHSQKCVISFNSLLLRNRVGKFIKTKKKIKKNRCSFLEGFIHSLFSNPEKEQYKIFSKCINDPSMISRLKLISWMETVRLSSVALHRISLTWLEI